MPRRVLVIGLDCAPPSLVFDRYREDMPRVSRLMEEGTYGALRSTVPPITVPAWMSMVTGRDPGEIGLYGFRNRVAGSYELHLPTSRDVRPKRVWDRLGDAGKRVASLFVPLTWPPTPVRGQMVSCFLTPDSDSPWAFPRGLESELSGRFGEYMPDVRDFRADDSSRILSDIYAMGRQHFAMATHIWRSRSPDFLMMVEMGPDRFHHAFWRQIDPSHPGHERGNPFEAEGRRYYAFLDEQIGALLDATDGETTVLIVSDHGARAMEGGICINEWLMREGWLTLKATPDVPSPLSPDMVDWTRTRAWGEGGYYGRVFLNVRGREPEGVVPPRSYEAAREELAAALEAIPDAQGRPLATRVLRPDHTYRETRGTAPDLMAFFGDLRHRSIGTVGGGSVYPSTDSLGTDGCNHDWDGVFVMAGGGAPALGPVDGLKIYDVASTVLGLLDVDEGPNMQGRDWSQGNG